MGCAQRRQRAALPGDAPNGCERVGGGARPRAERAGARLSGRESRGRARRDRGDASPKPAPARARSHAGSTPAGGGRRWGAGAAPEAARPCGRDLRNRPAGRRPGARAEGSRPVAPPRSPGRRARRLRHARKPAGRARSQPGRDRRHAPSSRAPAGSAISPDGRLLAVFNNDRETAFIDTRTRRVIRKLQGDGVFFLKDGKRFIDFQLAQEPERLVVRANETGRVVRVIPKQPGPFWFADDASRIVVAEDGVESPSFAPLRTSASSNAFSPVPRGYMGRRCGTPTTSSRSRSPRRIRLFLLGLRVRLARPAHRARSARSQSVVFPAMARATTALRSQSARRTVR